MAGSVLAGSVLSGPTEQDNTSRLRGSVRRRGRRGAAIPFSNRADEAARLAMSSRIACPIAQALCEQLSQGRSMSAGARFVRFDAYARQR